MQALGSTSENFRHHHCIGGVWVMASAFWVKGLGVLSFELDESRKAPELKGKREEGDFFFYMEDLGNGVGGLYSHKSIRVGRF